MIAKGPFIGGDKLSAADMSLGPKLYHLGISLGALQELVGSRLTCTIEAIYEGLAAKGDGRLDLYGPCINQCCQVFSMASCWHQAVEMDANFLMQWKQERVPGCSSFT